MTKCVSSALNMHTLNKTSLSNFRQTVSRKNLTSLSINSGLNRQQESFPNSSLAIICSACVNDSIYREDTRTETAFKLSGLHKAAFGPLFNDLKGKLKTEVHVEFYANLSEPSKLSMTLSVQEKNSLRSFSTKLRAVLNNSNLHSLLCMC